MLSNPQSGKAAKILRAAARRLSFLPRLSAAGWGVPALWLMAALLPAPAHANANLFVNSSLPSCAYQYCNAISQFGVLVGLNDTLNVTPAVNVLNSIAVDNGGKISVSTGTFNVGDSTHASIVDFSDTMTNSAAPCTGNTGCTHPTGTTFSTATKVWGGTQQNEALVNTAVTQFTDLASYWNGQSGSTRGAPAAAGNWNVNNSGSSTGMHIFTGTNYTMSNNLVIGCGAAGNATDVTGACDSTTLIVILLSGTANVSRNITFASNSGLTDDQVLFLVNATSSSSVLTIGANGTRTVHGNFWAPNGGFTLGNSGGASTTDIWGRVYSNASGSGTDIINHGVTIEYEEPVPEPGTWALLGGGLAAMVYAARRRKRAA